MADFDINSILSSLSSEDIENLKKTAAEVLGNMDGKQEQLVKNHQVRRVMCVMEAAFESAKQKQTIKTDI